MRGIATVAIGDKAQACAEALVHTVHATTPGVPVFAIADNGVAGADILLGRGSQWGGRYYKVNIDNLAPPDWQYILWLDADTLVIDSLEPIFQILKDGWDMVLTFGPDWANTVLGNQRPHYEEENIYTAKMLGGRFWHQPMGGVFAWARNERTHAFHQHWAHEWEQFSRRDQPAFIRALWQSRIKAYWLGTEWNYFPHRGNPERGEVVLHFPTAARTRINKPPHAAEALWQEYAGRV